MSAIMTYDEFLERLGLVATELSSLIYALYLQAIKDEDKRDSDDYGRIYRNL